jgi:hypothetical protein
MMTQQHSVFARRIQGRLWRSLVLIGVALGVAGCGAPSGVNEEPRYPEKRRPATLRSASDGEVMGANGQSVEDTLEGSPTNLHAAPGWEGEKGGMERAKDADCDPEALQAKNASATAGNDGAASNGAASDTTQRARAKKPCPKPSAR